jgi:hypothetical protein
MTPHERLEQLGVRLYMQTAEQDRHLAILWDKLSDTGELGLIAAKSAQSLSGFLGMFSPPCVLMYTMYDEQAQEIESINWARSMGLSDYAIYFSAWMHEEVRGTKRHAMLASSIYEVIFSMERKVIIGITKQVDLLPLHEKMGYTIVDQVPYLFDESPAWFMYLTDENFKKGKLYSTANKILDKEFSNG